MTFEQGCLAVITALTGVVSFLYLRNESARTAEIELLKRSSEDCQKWRLEKEPLITEMAERLGMAEATTSMINSCSTKGCQFAGKLISVKARVIGK